MHTSVLTKEVFEIFDPQPGKTYIDATVNGGGHARTILEHVGSEGLVLGIDWDRELIETLKRKSLKYENLKLICDNYANLRAIARKHNLGKIDGVLFDLGFSLYHIEESRRGFSFLRNEPLDMRYSPETNDLTAEKVVNTWPRETIENILREFGEERYAQRIAGEIVRERRHKRITTTADLVEVIARGVPAAYLKGRIHPATRTFQALRIAVNDEFANLKKGLEASVEILRPYGKVIVISFHSLEDRMVKTFFREKERTRVLKILTKKPLVPSREEVGINPKARSAKLRAAQKLI